jgi:hypothetical protein
MPLITAGTDKGILRCGAATGGQEEWHVRGNMLFQLDRHAACLMTKDGRVGCRRGIAAVVEIVEKKRRL